MSGVVLQVNRKPETPGQHGLPKVPVDAVRVTYHGLEGDYNRFRTYAKGGDPARAVMLMPLETLRELNAEGWPVQPGDMGENITSQGIPTTTLSSAGGIRWARQSSRLRSRAWRA